MRFREIEFVAASLPDRRLSKRLLRITASATTDPGATFPKMTRSDGELEGLYRFLNNARVKPGAVLEPHRQATYERTAAFPLVGVIHDTTEFATEGEVADDVGYLATGQRGFYGHVSLVVGPEAEPLGIGAVRAIFRNRPPARRGKGARKQNGFYTAKRAHREVEKWSKSVEAVEKRLPQGTAAVHIMDRGADSYALFATMVAKQRRFIIRLRQMPDRVVAGSVDAPEWDRLGDIAHRARYVCQREVFLRRRRAKSTPNVRYGARQSRWATLHLEASQLVLRRPQYVKDVPNELCLSLVRVHEPQPPVGEGPVEWWIVTTEPVSSQKDVEAVVDWYRARWKIEEYFKALKTGCAWRERQLETRDGLLNTLAVLMPIAWQLLATRDVARVRPNAAATTVFTERQLMLLRSLGKRPVPKKATVEQAILAVAAEGGHLLRNGAPGWQSIGRGLERIWWAEYGYVRGVEDAARRRRGTM